MENKKLITTINVLGTDYNIYTSTAEQDEQLKKCDGYIVPELKKICLDSKPNKQHQDHVLTHELIHAFLYESGLDVETWASSEEIVDWISLQLMKMSSTVKNGIKDFHKKENI